MAFEVHITLTEDSPAGRVVQTIAAVRHITTDQAVTQLLTEAAKQHSRRTPAEEMIGAFSSLEDQAVLDEAMAAIRAHRAEYDRVRDFGF